eukprot:1176437-Prymnesium_polylepis.1
MDECTPWGVASALQLDATGVGCSSWIGDARPPLSLLTLISLTAHLVRLRRQPYAAFSDAVFLSGEFIQHASSLGATDQFQSDHMRVQAMRIQLILCGALSALERDDSKALNVFLRSELCLATISEAVHVECKNLVR